ncbi:MAG: hypothetical protein RL653_887 [Pseudomonadota bacterium]|jgi:malonyl-CoA/methylmalonyl-CoA synthetase
MELASEQRTAVLDASGAHPYAALVARSAAVAGALLAGRETLAGARVALLVRPGAAFVEALYGTFLAGGCALVLSPLHPRAEVAWFLEDGGAEVVLADPELSGHLPAGLLAARVLAPAEAALHAAPGALPAVSGDAPALQVYTSGTTGKPKGAVVTHGNLAHQQAALGEAWKMGPADVLLHCLPLHHVHGLSIALLNALGAGAAVNFLSAFEPVACWEQMGRSTVFMAVPTLYAKLLAAWDAAPPDQQARWTGHARKLRLATSGSAALPVSLGERWRGLAGCLPLERYGMTELGVVLSNPLAPGGRRPGHVGRPLPGVEARVVDEAGNDAEVGELLVSGPSVFAGYHLRAEATAAAFVSHAGRRWFRTGDTVQREADGSYRVLGRTSVDVLKSGGYKLSALELEELLREHPAVAEVAVVGLPDEAWGDLVVACVVPRPGQDSACAEPLVRAWAKERVAPYKVPRQVLCFSELPRNALGKVVKPELVSAVRARLAASAPTPPATSG